MNQKKRVSIIWMTIMPMIVLGLLAMGTNLFSLRNISKVNNSGQQLANEHIVRITKLGEIENHIQTIHTYALSHVVATSLDTRIAMVSMIRDEEAKLDSLLEEYKEIMASEDQEAYQPQMMRCQICLR